MTSVWFRRVRQRPLPCCNGWPWTGSPASPSVPSRAFAVCAFVLHQIVGPHLGRVARHQGAPDQRGELLGGGVDGWAALGNLGWSYAEVLPPAKFVEGGNSHESMVGAGSIVSGAHVRNSVLSYDVTIREGAYVEGSVIMPGVRIGRGALRWALPPRGRHRAHPTVWWRRTTHVRGP